VKWRKPSPALVISIVALVMATTGSAVAAVNFARNSDKVDGKSAVSARASLRSAAGKLVATHRGGSERGKIDGKFLGGVVTGGARPFGHTTAVIDNSAAAGADLVVIPGFGKLSTTCRDESSRSGRENPSTGIAFSNLSGAAFNSARTIGGSDAAVGVLQPAGASQFSIDGSNTFSYHLARSSRNVLVQGVVRQNGANSSDATCVVYGVAVSLP
jgi:hypothetical protein